MTSDDDDDDKMKSNSIKLMGIFDVMDECVKYRLTIIIVVVFIIF